MKQLRILVLGLAVMLAWGNHGFAQSIAGEWKGLLKAEAMDLRMGFSFVETDGAWSGKIDLLEQGLKGLSLENFAFKDSTLSFKLSSASYEGRLGADGKIAGNWKQPGLSMPLDMERGTWAVSRPQEPQGPFPYKIEEVTYPNPAAEGVTLAGTLTLPEQPGPYPVVVLITGSGANNRDEEILMHKPFWVIADYLSRHGVGVLRFDDRGVGGSTGKHGLATSADFATDVLAGVAYLKGRKDLQISKIGLVGHSEGGVIGPLAAVESNDVGFLVMLAGTGVNGAAILGEQTELIMRADGATDEEIKSARGVNEAIYRIIVKSKTPKQAKAGIEKWARKAHKTDTAITEAAIKPMIPQINNVWFRYFLKHDPAPVLEKVKCPVLAVNGEKDVQVPADMNLVAIEAALKRGGNGDVTIREFPGLNHLFQHCTACNVREYALLEETFSPEVMEVLGKWILEKGK